MKEYYLFKTATNFKRHCALALRKLLRIANWFYFDKAFASCSLKWNRMIFFIFYK